MISKWGWYVSSSNLTSVILKCTYGENLMKLTQKLTELSSLQGKLIWNMKMRLCDLKMRLICLIVELDLGNPKMHLRWKFDEANSKIGRVIVSTREAMMNMKMRLCDLKMRLICLIVELDLGNPKMHLRWKFDEANSKIGRVIVFTRKVGRRTQDVHYDDNTPPGLWAEGVKTKNKTDRWTG